MSDKMQRNAQTLCSQMKARYDTEHHHKHNKYHLEYRKHYRTHPCNLSKPEEELQNNGSTGLVREFNLRKTRKRLDKGRIH